MRITTRAHDRGRVVYPAVGAVLVALGAGQVLGSPTPHLVPALGAVVVAGVAVGMLGVLPMVGFATILALDLLYAALWSTPPFTTFVATMVALFELARSGTRRAMVVGFGAAALAVAVLAGISWAQGTDDPANVVIALAYFGVTAGAGAVVRHTSAYARIARERTAALEREQEHLSELAAAAERARLARELHDVISHGVSIMVLQAEAARSVLPGDPDRAGEVIDAVADAGRRAIADLRELLGILRPPAAPTQTGRSVFLDLVEPLRRAGLRVDLVERGEPALLPPALAPTTYRLVQEALTNIVKHASATSVTIAVEYGPTGVVLDVLDDGAPGAPGPGTGSGLAGMAARVSAVGGTLHTGPTEGGFRVHAELPRVAS